MNYQLIQQSNVLYVEDDRHVSASVLSNIEALCKTIYVAYDGQEGLELYKKYKDTIDIIITDLNMPELSGIDMISVIRDMNYDVPIVITSAFGDEEILKKVINLDIDGFVAKPLKIIDLIKIMDKVLKPVFYKKELKKKDALIFQQSKLAAIGEMIGNIAHQWRQPLNSIGVIMMKLEFNRDNENLTKDIVTDTINDTNAIIAHMSKTIDDFRNFFLPNKEKKEFTVRDDIQSVLALMIPQFHNHNIKIKISGNQDIKIFGYENELKQVLINIVNNAKDAIIYKKTSNGLIKINIQSNKTHLIIKISDNAGGIPENLIDKIFEPYFTTKFKSQGTGLGLYMSKIIIEKNMKGNLSIQNNDKGAIFCIKLPKKLQ